VRAAAGRVHVCRGNGSVACPLLDLLLDLFETFDWHNAQVLNIESFLGVLPHLWEEEEEEK
jgi:hypothetical protein